ncbi:hypothetical protein CsSME_00032836 [Camellia sinensis var. sinensis]
MIESSNKGALVRVDPTVIRDQDEDHANISEYFSRISPNKFVSRAFDRGLQYAKTVIIYGNFVFEQSAVEPLTQISGLSKNMMCLIANICPESVDEVFALIPSLKGKKNKLTEPLKGALSELAILKHST